MPLQPGTRLGSYEITTVIGAGGMGEVYRARDLRLGRDVAIKVLPQASASDIERRARFEREAQAIASLSHPNVLAVHEFGVHEDQLFVVMELLEGETLRETLATGALPVRKAIDIATQVARGLSAAHGKGLIHRDLKPENIFLLRDGQVKILDFGLALSVATPSGSGATETIARTDPGTVLGTVGYMAPEQVRAGVVDARADLFALGAVLHEMLTGRRVFQRETAAETMTAILRDDPAELSASRAGIPPALDRIVHHALEKNPEERFQTARDVIFALTSLSGSAAQTSGATAVTSAGRARSAPPPGLVALAIAPFLLSLGVAAGWWWGRSSPPIEPQWSHFTQLTDLAGQETMPSISPDGGSFAFVGRTGGSWDIFVQRVGGRNPLLVAGDSKRHEVWPRFSPDGRQIAFNESDVDGGIFIIGATGESERRLTDAGANPAWSPDGIRIAFASEEVLAPHDRVGTSTLWLVDASGGPPRKIYDGDAVQPAWSPSGKRIAFWGNAGGQRDLFTVTPEGGDLVAVTSDVALDWAPVWSPDGRFLYFSSDRGGSMALWRIPIDDATGKTMGAPEAVAAGVEARLDLPSFSADGRTLLFRSQLQSVNPAAIPFDPKTERAGEPHVLVTRTGFLLPTGVSPDGAWIALHNQGDRQEDLFVMRRDGTDLRRVTDDPARDRVPRWTPDGKALTFYSNRDGHYSIWWIRPDGSGRMKLIADGSDLLYGVISPADGRLAFRGSKGAGYFAKPPFPAPEERVQKLANMEVDGGYVAPSTWSPDGRYLSGTWVTNDAPAGVGVYDVLNGKAWVLSHDRGIWIAPFLPDSRRVMYFTSDSELIVADAEKSARRVIPVKLPLPAATDAIGIAPDGRTLYYGAQSIESNVWKVERH
jgi:serine/threonine protein kinase/Tol biopolymer transport system component